MEGKLSLEVFREVCDAMGFQTEVSLFFDKYPACEYMIIMYDEDSCSFQNCSRPYECGSEYGEIVFKSLDALWHAVMPDGVCMERDWEHIRNLEQLNLFVVWNEEDLEEAREFFNGPEWRDACGVNGHMPR